MSSRSKRSQPRKPEQAEEQPQPNEEEIEELKAQADEAVNLLGLVKPQFPGMVECIPRGQLVEYLRHGSHRTYARYFKGFRPERIPKSRLLGFLSEEVFTNNNGVLAHLIIVLWNEQKRELYEATKKRLQVLNPNVEEIEKVPPALSREILTALCQEFPRDDVAVLTLVNDARFDREVLAELLPEWQWPPLKQRTPEELAKLAEIHAGEADASDEPQG